MEVTGTIKFINDTQVVSDRFRKREIVITTEAHTPYPQHVSFQVTQDKCEILNNYSEGDEVKAQFNLRGQEWNGPQGVKYFNTLEIWRIERLVNQAAEDDYARNKASDPAIYKDDNDDLPF